MRVPVVLALDAATDECSVAVACGESIVARTGSGLLASAQILPLVDALLQAQRIRLTDCDAIAFGAGPGAFTGLRLACGIAQGLGFGAGKPLIAVGNLAAVAADAFAQDADARRVLAAVDARIGEVYCAVYERAARRPMQIVAPQLARADELPALANQHAVDTLAGNALLAHAACAQGFGGRLLPQARADAAGIAALARAAFEAGELLAPAAAAPLYVRERVALTVAERQARGAAA
ncbi:MAG: tRNA (adenosine(37)-N6)-threonylcarbamoyltransferase complex dimerization subunit type 1 TsaB [Sutterellaceae bacterium]|nr:tRNA (adenosine(37)-N6)-threonylcarbamoyltransferase complex dimerization subunit type 1 TsaB [Burkholderiaceae bacterium]MDW8429344.1 tRNA (adenosine(37)-N6)-threonylcarbamoyltransferase complex dimerization subunit type 1 TsaB [Sutterellaceae bacterium]